MYNHYYVNKNKDAQGNHEVHKEGCNKMPALQNREYVGYFNNAHDAVRKAKQTYPTADGCYWCCPEAHKQ